MFLRHNFKAQNPVFGQVHVPFCPSTHISYSNTTKMNSTVRTEQARARGTSTMHSFTLKVGVEWPFAIHSILKGTVSVCTKGTRKNTNITEDALEK